MEKIDANNVGAKRVEIIKVCMLDFWDGTKYILEMNNTLVHNGVAQWRKIRDAALDKKRVEFDGLHSAGEMEAGAVMVKVRYTTMKKVAYDKRPASQELYEIQKEAFKEDNDGEAENSDGQETDE